MGRHRLLRSLAVAAIVLAAAAPATASAHPLGNFTINHYAGLTIAPDRVDLDVVIDMAEIPTFQERQTMDMDDDGSVSDEEASAWAPTACSSLADSLRLRRDGVDLPLTAGSSAATFPPGAGGLSTLRLECAFSAPVTPAIDETTALSFADGSYPERIGWREIVAFASGTILDTGKLPATSPSQRLTAYPANLIATPLDIRSASISARLDPAAPPSRSAAPGPAGGQPPAVAPAPASAAAVPGGVAGELPDIFRTADLTPLVLLGSILTAIVIGAGHALTPGHGKTLMAAYLVGTRGTAVHAVGLGLSVAISHTLGIIALALLIVGAGSVLPPDVVYGVTPVIAGASIVAIGGWMLVGEVRRRRAARLGSTEPVHGHDSGHDHDHDHEGTHARAHPYEHTHEHPHEHPRQHEHELTHARAHPNEHAQANALPNEHPHPHPHEHEHELTQARAHPNERPHHHKHERREGADPEVHSHGGVRHSHIPPAGRSLTWRGLFVLGLAGGLIPSTSALIILLGSIAAGRPAFGLVLVVAFGIGMAAVMAGVGLAMIVARTRLDRMPSRSSLGRLAAAAPLLASVAVLVLGSYLTWQAVAGSPVL